MLKIHCVFYTFSTSQFGPTAFQMLTGYMWVESDRAEWGPFTAGDRDLYSDRAHDVLAGPFEGIQGPGRWRFTCHFGRWSPPCDTETFWGYCLGAAGALGEGRFVIAHLCRAAKPQGGMSTGVAGERLFLPWEKVYSQSASRQEPEP